MRGANSVFWEDLHILMPLK